MIQSILTVTAPLRPDRADAAEVTARTLTAHSAALTNIAALHFLGVTVFRDDGYDPLLIIDVVCDGKPGHLWPALADRIGQTLVELAAATKDKSPPSVPAQVAAWLDAHTVYPSAQHFGHRGLDRLRIAAEEKMFGVVQKACDAIAPGTTPVAVHQQLRAAAGTPPVPPPRFPAWRRFLLAGICGRINTLLLTLGGLAVLYLAGQRAIAAIKNWQAGKPGWRALLDCAGPPLLVIGIVVLIGWLAYAYLLRRQASDPTQDAPRFDDEKRRRLAAVEPGINRNTVQNHLVSIVHVKPGVFRTLLLRAVLMVLKIKVGVCTDDGYLATMRTIHFAHWTLIDSGARMLFVSNYNGSWDSYLDDFVEKAAPGLTAAWTNCVGFPRTSGLTEDGARSGRLFKAWAFQSQQPAAFTHRAYPGLTVDQIERHAAVALGLYEDKLEPDAATRWGRML